jgi:hypothetical protein
MMQDRIAFLDLANAIAVTLNILSLVVFDGAMSYDLEKRDEETYVALSGHSL